MDIDLLTSWLKNTIPGIVILGALGSWVAVGVLWLVKISLRNASSIFEERWRRRKSTLLRPIVTELVHIYVEKDSFRAQTYLAYQVMTFFCALFVMAASVVAFVYAISQQPGTFTQVAAPVSAGGFFLALYSAANHFFRVWVPYVVPNLGEEIETAKQEVLAKREAKSGQPSSS
jgi:hypothetical protein